MQRIADYTKFQKNLHIFSLIIISVLVVLLAYLAGYSSGLLRHATGNPATTMLHLTILQLVAMDILLGYQTFRIWSGKPAIWVENGELTAFPRHLFHVRLDDIVAYRVRFSLWPGRKRLVGVTLHRANGRKLYLGFRGLEKPEAVIDLLRQSATRPV